MGPLPRRGRRPAILALGAADAPLDRAAGRGRAGACLRRRGAAGLAGPALSLIPAASRARGGRVRPGAGPLPALRRGGRLLAARGRSASRCCWCWTICTVPTCPRCGCSSSSWPKPATAACWCWAPTVTPSSTRQHPLADSLLQLHRHAQVQRLLLGGFSRRRDGRVRRRRGAELAPELGVLMHEQTEGHPLFLAEMMRDLLPARAARHRPQPVAAPAQGRA